MAMTVDEANQKMEQTLEHLHSELKKIRTGRANPAILDSVMIDAYGQQMPLKHAATVQAVDAQLLQVTPFDPNNLGNIVTAISDSNLGLNPSDDGRVVRVPVPQLTEERRKELVKTLSEKAEDARVSLRTIRHDVLKTAKQQEKDGELSKDDVERVEKRIGELMDDFNKRIDDALAQKEAEIMTV